LVKPFANEQVILLGDAAGIVSPLTAGGIHTAMHYGVMLAETLADFLRSGGTHPANVLAKSYPRFYAKQLLRWGYERFAPNWFLNAALTNPLFTYSAEHVFFKRKQLA
jgi:flavin-dependent dehydrogenase